ncbi:SulP family inorganic anion transporter, partial [bacterium]|nr:SulP family inorganic anion transporter [bacterium]
MPVWVKRYTGQKFRLDFFAGLGVALFALPQCMAYAMLAGLEPKHGLYAVIVGSVLGSIFGSSRHLHTGPVNSAAILTATAMALYVGDSHFMAMVFLLTMLAGIFQLVAGLIRLGNMTQFISRSVLEGFITAAGLLIAINQLPNLLGITSHSSVSILSGLQYVFSNIFEFRVEALALGLGTIALIVFLNKISPKSLSGVPLIPSYLIAILITAGIVAVLQLQQKGIAVVGEIPKSLPSFSIPVFNPALIKALAPGALAIALIGVAESITIGKSIASRVDERIDPDRELIGQGIAKIGVSFLSGMPVSGSFTRTALNYRLGSATRLSNIYSAAMLSLIVLIFGRFVQYIPVAALAGILIIACVNMVNWKHARLALRTTRSDALAILGTFAGALIYPLDKAVFIGVGISLILFLR